MADVPDVLIIGVAAFFIGFMGLYLFHRFQTSQEKKILPSMQHLEQLNYYEQQIIQLRIRMDALSLESENKKNDENRYEIKPKITQTVKVDQQENSEEIVKQFEKIKPTTSAEIENEKIESENSKTVDQEIDLVEDVSIESEKQIASTPNLDHDDITLQILLLITSADRTSRDIQIELGKSREHISRIMTNLFRKKYLKRTRIRPFEYSVTPKGKKTLKVLKRASRVKQRQK